MRRRLLAATGLVSVGALLVGCSGTTPLTPAQAVADAGLLLGDPMLGTGLIGAYDIFRATYPAQVSADVDAKAQAAFNEAEGLLATAKAATGAVIVATNLNGVLSDASTVMGLMQPIITPLAAANPALLDAWEAATVLLPVVQAEVAALTPAGVTAPVPASLAAAKKKPTFPSSMTEGQARKVLSP